MNNRILVIEDFNGYDSLFVDKHHAKFDAVKATRCKISSAKNPPPHPSHSQFSIFTIMKARSMS